MPSASDDFGGKHCHIILNPSRKSLYLYGNDPTEIQIGDIANALSHQSRFTGHLMPGKTYSVAEHELDVEWVLRMWGATVLQRKQGIMHDSSEYGLSDIAAPFKKEIGLYYEKEALIWNRVAARYRLPVEMDPLVKTADFVCLFIEALHFVVPDDPDRVTKWLGWNDYKPYVEETMRILKQKTWFGFRPAFRGMGQERARKAYLKRWDGLFTGENGNVVAA